MLPIEDLFVNEGPPTVELVCGGGTILLETGFAGLPEPFFVPVPLGGSILPIEDCCFSVPGFSFSCDTFLIDSV